MQPPGRKGAERRSCDTFLPVEVAGCRKEYPIEWIFTVGAAAFVMGGLRDSRLGPISGETAPYRKQLLMESEFEAVRGVLSLNYKGVFVDMCLRDLDDGQAIRYAQHPTTSGGI